MSTAYSKKRKLSGATVQVDSEHGMPVDAVKADRTKVLAETSEILKTAQVATYNKIESKNSASVKSDIDNISNLKVVTTTAVEKNLQAMKTSTGKIDACLNELARISGIVDTTEKILSASRSELDLVGPFLKQTENSLKVDVSDSFSLTIIYANTAF